MKIKKAEATEVTCPELGCEFYLVICYNSRQVAMVIARHEAWHAKNAHLVN